MQSVFSHMCVCVRVCAFAHACVCVCMCFARPQEALEKYSAAFCSLEEPPGIQEYPDVKPHANDHSNGYDTSHDRPTKLQADMWE